MQSLWQELHQRGESKSSCEDCSRRCLNSLQVAGMHKSSFLRAANAKPLSEALRRAKKLPPQRLLLHIEELQCTEDAPKEDAQQHQSQKD